jgi:hypothetical protein
VTHDELVAAVGTEQTIADRALVDLDYQTAAEALERAGQMLRQAELDRKRAALPTN